MNNLLYRRFYLGRNIGKFIMVKKVVKPAKVNCCFVYCDNVNEKGHELVLSGEAFWQTYNELCIGYVLESDNKVFRPIFSFSRQRILNELNEQFPTVVKSFWDNYRTRYGYMLYTQTTLPKEIIFIILNFAYPRFNLNLER